MHLSAANQLPSPSYTSDKSEQTQQLPLSMDQLLGASTDCFLFVLGHKLIQSRRNVILIWNLETSQRCKQTSMATASVVDGIHLGFYKVDCTAFLIIKKSDLTFDLNCLTENAQISFRLPFVWLHGQVVRAWTWDQQVKGANPGHRAVPPSVWPHLFCGAGHEKRRV